MNAATESTPAPLWVVTGPTASGKSALALQLAERLDLEIVSMDSMAVYRQMDIGTAKPSAAERARVPHHLIDLVAPSATFDTARWCEAAAAALDDIHGRGRRALFVGGTPLYLMAFFKGMMQGPAADPELRQALAARESGSPGVLYAELQAADPVAAQRIDRRDLRRVVRALEVLQLTGRPISAQQDHFDRDGWLRPCRIVAVQRERDELHARVRQRTETMLERGLLAETEAIERGGGFSPTSGAAIGYAECRLFLRGRFKDREELRNRIRRNTHQLIRRQTTWFRRLRDIAWLPPAADADALASSLRAAVSDRRGR
ncbi:MAG: tRNA (adenosine(37)-N6)-dimethylallyltransferase MiaA [Planctomycetes bacterium]|nr:tRNA (adenosine(37)-N6)-dimethylallyltransferase MiaA [Planctomycetota bacterium]